MSLTFCLGWSQVSKENYGVAIYVVGKNISIDAHVLSGSGVSKP